STVGMVEFIAQVVPGLLMEQELKYLTLVTRDPARPAVAILGGAKVSDKIEVIENLMKIVDRVLIGGAMAYTFLKAQSLPTGTSLVEDDKVELAKRLLATAAGKLVLPLDHVVAAELKEGAEYREVETIPDGMMGLDIGPRTVAAYSRVIAGAKTIVWNGPMGVFEKPPFDRGTVAIGRAVADSGATSVVGGGDSEKAVKSAGVAGKISHISTGGGASLEFLAGLDLPGVAVLRNR
ncbi:MAG: phosphoglycerate kinase, partial [Acidobacteria bacterium]|nr:phosphoglycerate kinase [Acidobacteriota bacterium]